MSAPILPFDEWSKNSTETDPVNKLKSFAGYVRAENFKNGTYDDDVEAGIQEGIRDVVKAQNIVNDETPEEELKALDQRLFAPQSDFDADANFVYEKINRELESGDKLLNEEQEDSLRRYVASKKLGLTEQADQYKDKVTEILSDPYIVNTARIDASTRGIAPVVAINDSNGNRILKQGPDFSIDNVRKNLDSLLKSGAITAEDLPTVKRLAETNLFGMGTNADLARSGEFSNDVSDLISKDDTLQKAFDTIKEDRAIAEEEANDSVWENIGEGFASGLGALVKTVGDYATSAIEGVKEMGPKGIPLMAVSGTKGVFEKGAKRQGEEIKRGAIVKGGIVEMLTNSPLGDKYSRAEIERFSDDFIKANTTLDYDKDKPETGIRVLSTGAPVVSPLLFARPDALEESIQAAGLNQEQAKVAREGSAAQLKKVAPDMIKSLMDADADDALTAYTKAKEEGKTDEQFITEWLNNEDNYENFKNRAKSFVMSSIRALGDTALTIPALLGNENAAKTMVDMSKANEKYSRYAELFGDKFGVGQELVNTLPSVLLDIGISAGTGGIATGAKTTVSTMTKGVASNIAKRQATSIATKTSLNMMSGLSKEAAETLAQAAVKSNLTTKAIRSVADNIATLPTRPNGFLTNLATVGPSSFMRSAGSTYASIYGELPANMSHEEKHQKAFGTAVTAGAFTALLTAGMSTIGGGRFGGTESLATRNLDDLTFNQLKRLYATTRVGAERISDAAIKKELRQVSSGAFKEFSKGFAGATAGEAFEEGVDQAFQMIAEDAALNRDTPIAEIGRNVWLAAGMGGIFGAGFNLPKQFAPTFTKEGKQAELRKIDTARFALFEQVANKLNQTGSPKTAAAIAQIYQDAQQQQPEAAAPAEGEVMAQPEIETVDWEPVDPAKGLLSDFVGRLAFFGDKSGIVRQGTDGIVLQFFKPLPTGETSVVLGDPADKAAGKIDIRFRIRVTKNDMGETKAGSPVIKRGDASFALPHADTKPQTEVVYNKNGNPIGIVLRGAKEINGSRSMDVTVGIKDGFVDIAKYYGVDLSRKTSAEAAEANKKARPNSARKQAKEKKIKEATAAQAQTAAPTADAGTESATPSVDTGSSAVPQVTPVVTRGRSKMAEKILTSAGVDQESASIIGDYIASTIDPNGDMTTEDFRSEVTRVFSIISGKTSGDITMYGEDPASYVGNDNFGRSPEEQAAAAKELNEQNLREVMKSNRLLAIRVQNGEKLIKVEGKDVDPTVASMLDPDFDFSNLTDDQLDRSIKQLELAQETETDPEIQALIAEALEAAEAEFDSRNEDGEESELQFVAMTETEKEVAMKAMTDLRVEVIVFQDKDGSLRNASVVKPLRKNIRVLVDGLRKTISIDDVSRTSFEDVFAESDTDTDTDTDTETDAAEGENFDFINEDLAGQLNDAEIDYVANGDEEIKAALEALKGKRNQLLAMYPDHRIHILKTMRDTKETKSRVLLTTLKDTLDASNNNDAYRTKKTEPKGKKASKRGRKAPATTNVQNEFAVILDADYNPQTGTVSIEVQSKKTSKKQLVTGEPDDRRSNKVNWVFSNPDPKTEGGYSGSVLMEVDESRKLAIKVLGKDFVESYEAAVAKNMAGDLDGSDSDIEALVNSVKPTTTTPEPEETFGSVLAQLLDVENSRVAYKNKKGGIPFSEFRSRMESYSNKADNARFSKLFLENQTQYEEAINTIEARREALFKRLKELAAEGDTIPDISSTILLEELNRYTDTFKTKQEERAKKLKEEQERVKSKENYGTRDKWEVFRNDSEKEIFNDLLEGGYPLTDMGLVYGYDAKGHEASPSTYLAGKRKYLRELIQERYPVVGMPTEENGHTIALRSKHLSWQDSNGNVVKAPVIVDKNGAAVFTNDPIITQAQLNAGYSVLIPSNTKNLNPTIQGKVGKRVKSVDSPAELSHKSATRKGEAALKSITDMLDLGTSFKKALMSTIREVAPTVRSVKEFEGWAIRRISAAALQYRGTRSYDDDEAIQQELNQLEQVSVTDAMAAFYGAFQLYSVSNRILDMVTRAMQLPSKIEGKKYTVYKEGDEEGPVLILFKGDENPTVYRDRAAVAEKIKGMTDEQLLKFINVDLMTKMILPEYSMADIGNAIEKLFPKLAEGISMKGDNRGEAIISRFGVFMLRKSVGLEDTGGGRLSDLYTNFSSPPSIEDIYKNIRKRREVAFWQRATELKLVSIEKLTGDMSESSDIQDPAKRHEDFLNALDVVGLRIGIQDIASIEESIGMTRESLIAAMDVDSTFKDVVIQFAKELDSRIPTEEVSSASIVNAIMHLVDKDAQTIRAVGPEVDTRRVLINLSDSSLGRKLASYLYYLGWEPDRSEYQGQSPSVSEVVDNARRMWESGNSPLSPVSRVGVAQPKTIGDELESDYHEALLKIVTSTEGEQVRRMLAAKNHRIRVRDMAQTYLNILLDAKDNNGVLSAPIREELNFYADRAESQFIVISTLRSQQKTHKDKISRYIRAVEEQDSRVLTSPQFNGWNFEVLEQEQKVVEMRESLIAEYEISKDEANEFVAKLSQELPRLPYIDKKIAIVRKQIAELPKGGNLKGILAKMFEDVEVKAPQPVVTSPIPQPVRGRDISKLTATDKPTSEIEADIKRLEAELTEARDEQKKANNEWYEKGNSLYDIMAQAKQELDSAEEAYRQAVAQAAPVKKAPAAQTKKLTAAEKRLNDLTTKLSRVSEELTTTTQSLLKSQAKDTVKAEEKLEKNPIIRERDSLSLEIDRLVVSAATLKGDIAGFKKDLNSTDYRIGQLEYRLKDPKQTGKRELKKELKDRIEEQKFQSKGIEEAEQKVKELEQNAAELRPQLLELNSRSAQIKLQVVESKATKALSEKVKELNDLRGKLNNDVAQATQDVGELRETIAIATTNTLEKEQNVKVSDTISNEVIKRNGEYLVAKDNYDKVDLRKANATDRVTKAMSELNKARTILNSRRLVRAPRASLSDTAIRLRSERIRVNSMEVSKIGLDKGTETALRNIAANGAPHLRVMANILLDNKDLINNVQVALVEIDPQVAGLYISDRLVMINMAGHNGRGLADVLIHELTHALTVSALRNPEAAKRISSLRVLAQRKLRDAGFDVDSAFYRHAFSDNAEFLSAVFTDSHIQNALRSTEVEGGRNWIARMWDIVLKALGIKNSNAVTALDEVISFANMASTTYGSHAAITRQRAEAIAAENDYRAARLNLDRHTLNLLEEMTQGDLSQVQASPVVSDAMDAEYLDAVERGDLDTAKQIINNAAEQKGLKIGHRAAAYKNYVPLLPSTTGGLGSAYYAILGGDLDQIKEFDTGLQGENRNNQDMQFIADQMFIDLGSKPLFVNHPSEVFENYSNDKLLMDRFDAWLQYQYTVNQAYENLLSGRPRNDWNSATRRIDANDNLQARRAGRLFMKTAESKKAYRDSLLAQGYTDQDIKQMKLDQDTIETSDAAKFNSFLFDAGIVTSIVVDWTKAKSIGRASGDGRMFTEVALANPNQIKSADPVVRDDQGNVIPPSSRFDSTSNDIRFSLSDGTSTDSRIRNLIPAGFELTPDSSIRGAFSVQGTDIRYNPELVESSISDALPEVQDTILSTMVNHELAHAAADSVMAPEDYEEVAKELGPDILDAVADSYYQSQYPDATERAAQIAADRESGILSDSEIAAEWFRSKVEKATYGKSTEEVFNELSHDNSLIARFAKYLDRFISFLTGRQKEVFSMKVAADISRATRVLELIMNDGVPLANPDAQEEVGHAAEFIEAVRTGNGNQTHFTMGLENAGRQGSAISTAWSRLSKAIRNLPPDISRTFKRREADLEKARFAMERFAPHYRRQLEAALKNGADINDVGLILGSTEPTMDAAALDRVRVATRAFAKTLPKGTKDIDKIMKDEQDRLFAAEKVIQDSAFRKRQTDAIARMDATAPELSKFLQEFRKKIDKHQIAIGYSDSVGIYLTRTYKFFNTKGWADAARNAEGKTYRVKGEDIDFGELRDKAARAYEEDVRQEYRKNKKPLTAEILRREVYAKLDNFLEWLHENATEDKGESLSQDLRRFMPKSNVDTDVRALLGETINPVENALRTFHYVAVLDANQKALTEIKDQLIENGMGSETSKVGYVKIFKDATNTKAPLAGLYVREDVAKEIEAEFGANGRKLLRESDSMIQHIGGTIAKASGIAMTLKTLPSIGFQMRNIITNLGVLPATQGVIPLLSPQMRTAHSFNLAQLANFPSSRANASPELVAEVEQLIGLGILRDSQNRKLFEDLMRGYADRAGVTFENALDNILGMAQRSDFNGILEFSKKAGKILGKPAEFLSAVNALFDDMSKAQMYFYERYELEKAYPEKDSAWHDNEAATKVKLVMPTHSQQLDIIRSFNRHPLALLAFPFARWKTEMLRTMVNTVKLAGREIASGNPRMMVRGVRRGAGFSIVTVAGLKLASAVLAAAFRKITGDDEENKDEIVEDPAVLAALRLGLPEYQQGHSLYVTTNGRELSVIDVTAIAPHAIVSDLFTMVREGRATGKGVDAKRIASYFANQFVGSQIAAGAVLDLRNNKNDFGQNIYEETDDMVTQTQKMFMHVYRQAYEPGIVAKWRAANRTGEQNPDYIWAGEFLGARPKVYTLDQVARTGFYKLKESSDSIKRQRATLSGGRALEADKIREIMTETQDAENLIQAQTHSLIKALQSIGTDDRVIAQRALSTGMSKKRVSEAFAGVNTTWFGSKEWFNNMSNNVTNVGEDDPRARYQIMKEVVESSPRTVDVTNIE